MLMPQRCIWGNSHRAKFWEKKSKICKSMTWCFSPVFVSVQCMDIVVVSQLRWMEIEVKLSNTQMPKIWGSQWQICSTWSQRPAVRDLLLIFCSTANVCTQWHGISWTSKYIIFISSPQLILGETVMSSALPLVKRRKLQVVGIYICSLEGSIKARFVFFLFSLLAIQQIGAFSAAIVLFIIEYCRDDVVMSFCGSFSRLESPSQIFSTVLEPCCASAKTFSSVTQ